MKLMKTYEFAEQICQALGVPVLGVSRVRLDIDLNRPHDPVILELERVIDWQMIDGAAPAIKEVIERYFRPGEKPR